MDLVKFSKSVNKPCYAVLRALQNDFIRRFVNTAPPRPASKLNEASGYRPERVRIIINNPRKNRHVKLPSPAPPVLISAKNFT